MEELQENEIQTYFLINEIGHITWLMNHDMADGRIPENQHAKINAELLEMRKVQIKAITSLNRFGVQQPFKGQSEQPSPSYWAWFRWWDGYIKGMSVQTWKILEQKMKNKEDISEYRPQGDWRSNIEDEEKKMREAEEFWDKINKKTEPQRKIRWQEDL